ncbi:hypothetical protein D9M71_556870 [compost metagenome]
MVLGRQAQQRHAQHGAMLQVERLLPVGFDKGLNLRLLIAHIALTAFDRHRQLWGDLLAWATVAAVMGERGAQALVPRQQRIKTALQGLQVQRAMQAQADPDVVGSALRLHLPQEPLALLGKRQRHHGGVVAHQRNGQVRRGYALFKHFLQVLATLFQRQIDEALSNFRGDCGVHHTSSISSSRADSLLSVCVSAGADAWASCSAKLARVGCWKISCGVRLRPSSSCTRDTTLTASSEWPPSSKK